MGVHDSLELAWSDWQGSAQFDRLDDEDAWRRPVGAGLRRVRRRREARRGCASLGLSWLPDVGWAERGDLARRRARQLRAPVPRHVGHRHRCRRAVRPQRAGGRGRAGSSASTTATASTSSSSTGGVGHRRPRRGPRAGRRPARCPLEPGRRRRLRADRAGRRPHHRRDRRATTRWSAGSGRSGSGRRRRRWSPASRRYVDGRMLDIAADAGVRLVNRDRMWHYTEGLRNWDPIWPQHGIRILPGPSSMWFDALGTPAARALPARATTPSAPSGTCGRRRTPPGTTTRGSS